MSKKRPSRHCASDADHIIQFEGLGGVVELDGGGLRALVDLHDLADVAHAVGRVMFFRPDRLWHVDEACRCVLGIQGRIDRRHEH
eukprot:742247-Prymnesium_polylepis.1